MERGLLIAAALLGAAFIFGRARTRGLGEFWLDDPRLPDKDEANRRIWGDMRPKVSPPWRADVVAERLFKPRNAAPKRLQVMTNRTRTRWWFEVLIGHKTSESRNPKPASDGLYYEGMMMDYATTTSPKVAQGWIDALKGKRRSG